MSGTLVIGGAGFLAGHLIPKLRENGTKVRVIDIVPPEAVTRLKGLEYEYRWKSVLDIRSEDFDGIDSVIYLAAQADVPLSISSPTFTFQQNVMSVVNFMDTIRRLKTPPKVIYMSSESVYGLIPAEQQPITEDTRMNPTNAYGVSKASAELVVNGFAQQYGLPTTVIRSTTMYGPASRTKQVVPIFIRQALANKDITIEGDGSASRDFNYVLNNVAGIMKILSDDRAKGIYNLGSGVELSVKELAEHIIRISGSKSKLHFGEWRPGEKGIRLNISIEKARDEFGYEPIYTVEEGLTQTIDWIKKNG